MDEILNSLFRQVLKYEQIHYRIVCSVADGEGDAQSLLALASEMSGTITGLRIAICIVNGWKIDPYKEGIADQAVRTYAETYNLGEVE